MGIYITFEKSSETATLLGANGFFGNAISAQLVKDGWKITSSVPLEISAVEELKISDFIINCVGTTEADPEKSHLVNSLFPKNLAKFAQFTDARLIHIGSSAEYAPSPSPLTETSPTKVSDPYSKSKLAGTEFVRENSAPGRSIVLRPFGVVQRNPNLTLSNSSNLNKLIFLARNRRPVSVKNLLAIRDLISIEDVAFCISRLMEVEGEWPMIANLASGNGHTVVDIIREVNPSAEIIGETSIFGDTYIGCPQVFEKLTGYNFPRDISKILN